MKPASARQPAIASPSAKFVEHPKFFTKTCIIVHRGMLDGVMWNEKIKVALVGIYRKLQHGLCNLYKIRYKHVYSIFIS